MFQLLSIVLCLAATERGATKYAVPEWLMSAEKRLNCSLSVVSRVSMPHPRYGHTSTLYKDALFIFGGRIINRLSEPLEDTEHTSEARTYRNERNRLAAKDSWMYNMTTNQWKVLEFHAEYYSPRIYATSFLHDEKIHIIGGRVDSIQRGRGSITVLQEILDRIDIFNLREMQWEKPKKFHLLSSYFPAVSGTVGTIPLTKNTDESMVFVLGGYNSDALRNPSAKEQARRNSWNKPISSTLTKKYGYYAFHSSNLTQAHVFPAFHTLPVFGHQMQMGPDHTAVVMGGYQRSPKKNTDADTDFEDMRKSGKVHLLRHKNFLRNITQIEEAQWPVRHLPSMNHPRAYFCSVRLTSRSEGGIGDEDTDVLLVYGGADQSDPKVSDAAEYLNVNRPHEGWSDLSTGDDHTSPSHAAVAHRSEKRYTGQSTFLPVHRVAISGGVSEYYGYHGELLIFEVKFRERHDESAQSHTRRRYVKAVLFLVFVGWALWAIGHTRESQGKQSYPVKRKFFPLSKASRSFKEGPVNVDNIPLGAVTTHSSLTGADPSTTNRQSFFDGTSGEYADSLSTTLISVDTVDFRKKSEFENSQDFSFNNQRIPPQGSASQISQLSMPTANVSISSSYEFASPTSMQSHLHFSDRPERSLPPPEIKRTNSNVYSDYQLINEIGRGDDSIVYTAVLSTGELVAVKVIRVTSPSHDDIRPGSHTYYPFTHEAQVLLSLPHHENLIQFYAIFRHQEKKEIHIVMELVEAGSLHSLLTKITTPFSLSTIRKYTKQLIEGLSHLHANGVVHCDIKGENVLIGRDGHLKVTDFGQSRRIHSTEKNLSSGEECGFESDVWLLGCTIMEMLYRGSEFLPTLEVPPCGVSRKNHESANEPTGEESVRRIHCSCCPCLLGYQKLLRAQAEKNPEAEFSPEENFPFALPDQIDPSLFDFLRQCFQMHDRPGLAKLSMHPFLHQSFVPKNEESVNGDEIDRFASSPESQVEKGPRTDVSTNERVDFSTSLDCTIYDF